MLMPDPTKLLFWMIFLSIVDAVFCPTVELFIAAPILLLLLFLLLVILLLPLLMGLVVF